MVSNKLELNYYCYYYYFVMLYGLQLVKKEAIFGFQFVVVMVIKIFWLKVMVSFLIGKGMRIHKLEKDAKYTN